MPETARTVCVNHPATETLLHCNKCGRPVCIKCVKRTPVGYRCKDCLNVQQAGYYTATAADYVIVAGIGIVASSIGGIIAAVLGAFWFFTIFYAPIAGGTISEIIRRAIQKRRGKYLWLIACVTVVLGTFIGAGLLPLFATFAGGGTPTDLIAIALYAPFLMFRAFFNISVWIYVVIAVSTIYARLRN